jgi:hypothetical protein
MFRAEAAEAEKEKRVLYNADIGDCINWAAHGPFSSVSRVALTSRIHSISLTLCSALSSRLF